MHYRLYEVLVPTIYGDTMKPISTRHHKEWDKKIQKITGGLTIMSPGRGRWLYNGQEYHERVIPVRIHCEIGVISTIVQLTLSHYRQKAVMYYCVAEEVRIVRSFDIYSRP